MSIILALVAILIGIPLFIALSGGAIFGYHSGGMEISLAAGEIARLSQNNVLISIPLFTFAGYLLSESKTPQRLVRLIRASLGWLPGGMAIVTIVVCSIFTALTGASGVTIVAMGGLLYPALRKDNYPESFSLGLVTTSGSLGLLFPPALPLILYAIAADVGVSDIFAAGILPGFLMLIVLGTYSIYQGTKIKQEKVPFSWKELKDAFLGIIFEFPLPFVVLGGIFSGLLAVSEAAAITACYCLIIEVFVYRDISFKKLGQVTVKAMTMVGAILIIMGASYAFSNVLIDQDVPSRLFEVTSQFIHNKITFLILLNCFLLLVGCMLDVYSAIMLVVPLILPLAAEYGIDPVHLGIIFLANLQIGYCTPPVGMNLFIASYRFKEPMIKLALTTLPFLGLLIISLLVITYWPSLSLWLPGLIGGGN